MPCRDGEVLEGGGATVVVASEPHSTDPTDGWIGAALPLPD